MDDVVGPDLRALYTTRRWLIAMLTSLLILVSTAAAVSRWPQLSGFEHAAVLLAVLLVCVGAAASRRPAFLWFSLAGPFVLLLTALLAPHGSPPWIPMPNVVTYSIGFAIIMISRRLGAVCIVIAPIAIAAVWLDRPTNIVAGALQVGGGWIAVLQVMAICLGIWLAWGYLFSRAQRADRDFRVRESQASASIAQQERARIWRDTAARIHESVLNSIRYALSADTIDGARLAHELESPGAPPEAMHEPETLTIDRLLTAVLADPIAAGLVRIPPVNVGVTLAPDVFAACRAAIIEASHNALRHGHATRMSLSFTVDEPGVLRIRATDNGIGLPAQVRPGIGTETVFAESLTQVGGTWSMSTTEGSGAQVEFTVPATTNTPTRGRRRAPYSPFDRGRLLVSAALAGSCAVGIVYFLLLGAVRPLDRTGGAHYWLAVVCGIAGAATAVTVVARRRHLSVLAGIGLALVPAFVPWFLRTAEYGCGESAVLAAVLNVAGFSVIVIALWSGVLPGIVGILTWASGIAIVTVQVPTDCRQAVTLALVNSLLVIPIAVIATFIGVRSSQRSADRLHAARRRQLLEQSRADTAMDLNANLYGSVEEASAILGELAHGRPLDESTRRRLEAVDSRIRVAIQVDSSRAGGLAAFAQRAVEAAGVAGRSVQVRAIGGSDDPEPLPLELERAVTSALIASASQQPMLQVFTDGSCDYLSAIVDEDGLRASGLEAGAVTSYDATEVQVLLEDEDPDEAPCYSILISRPIAAVSQT